MGCFCYRRYYHAKDPQPRLVGKLHWALWKPDRLVTLEAESEGRVTLNKGCCNSDKLLLNYQTSRNGWIRAELIEPNLWPPSHLEAIPGFSFADCEPLNGDSLSGEIKWKGSSDLSKFRGRNLSVRIELCQARLFSIAGFSYADRSKSPGT
jgi:hypothetical protein